MSKTTKLMGLLMVMSFVWAACGVDQLSSNQGTARDALSNPDCLACIHACGADQDCVRNNCVNEGQACYVPPEENPFEHCEEGWKACGQCPPEDWNCIEACNDALPEDCPKIPIPEPDPFEVCRTAYDCFKNCTQDDVQCIEDCNAALPDICPKVPIPQEPQESELEKCVNQCKQKHTDLTDIQQCVIDECL